MKKTAATAIQTNELMQQEKEKAISLSVVPKNFRQQADIEAFYRFVYENDLRLEALDIFKSVRTQKATGKSLKARVKH